VPRELWRALQRFAAWVEPALIAEWQRLMRAYAERQGRVLDERQLGAAMTWADPARDVVVPREIALRTLAAGGSVHCVWTGQRLQPATLDIDHCTPRSAWPCGDLWNLLPAHRRVNQHLKRDRLPSAAVLRQARDGVIIWWQSAYLCADSAFLQRRFAEEARASLPALVGPIANTPDVDDVYAAVELQRLRLHQDQQGPEWAGPRVLAPQA
jgi:hypothetical protein